MQYYYCTKQAPSRNFPLEKGKKEKENVRFQLGFKSLKVKLLPHKQLKILVHKATAISTQ